MRLFYFWDFRIKGTPLTSTGRNMRQMAAEMAKKKENVPTNAVDSLFNKVSSLIEQARVRVATAMNVAEVYTKY